jgi:cation:H+ antiporter
MSFVLLIVGFVLLIKCADILIDSAARLAHLLAIPSFIIGFSIIAFGTSAPELAIGIFSGIREANQITLGDVVGSCIANIALIIGITSIIHSLHIEKSVLYKDIPISFAMQLLLAVLLLSDGVLSRIDAAVLLALFVAFLAYIFKRSKELRPASEEAAPEQIEKPALVGEDIPGPGRIERAEEGEAEEAAEAAEAEEAEELIEAAMEMEESKLKDSVEVKEHSVLKLAGWIAVSLVGIIGGGNLIVNSSTEIARMFGLSDVLIGLTVVAIGTSLPELVTSVVAALRKQSDIAVGNIIGSNIFNVLFVLGASALIHPIPTVGGIAADFAFMLAATCGIFILSLRRKRVGKAGGIALLVLYAAFMAFKIIFSK